MRTLSLTLLLALAPLALAADKKKKPATPVPPEPLAVKLGDPLSPRALVQRPPTLRGVVSWSLESRRHRGTIACLALSPDGMKVATGGIDGTIRIWDVETGKLQRALIGHAYYVYGLDWSPDGSMLASAGSFDATVRIWDAATGYPLKTLKGHPAYVQHVAWSPDGRTVLGAGGESGIISHWEAASGKQLGKFDLGRRISSVAWHPEGKTAVITAQGMALQICDLDGYRVDKSWGDAKLGYVCAAWSPDGKKLAAGADKSTYLLDAEGKELHQLSGRTLTVAWDADGKRLAGSLGNGVRVWHAADGSVVTTIEGPAYWLAFHPSGKQVVAVSPQDLSIFDLEAGKVGRTENIAGTDPPLWWPGRPLITGVGTAKLTLWDAATGKSLRSLAAPNGWFNAATYSPDGKTLATAGSDGKVRLWEVAGGKESLAFDGHKKKAVKCVTFSPDGKLMASGAADGSLLVWKPADGTVVHEFKGHGGDIACLAWGSAASGLLASGGIDKTARVWNVKTGKPGREFTEPGETAVLALAFSPDAKTLASGHFDHRVRMWQVGSGKLVHTLEDPGSPPQVASLAWAGNDSVLAAGRSNHTLQLWNPKTGRIMHDIPVMSPCLRVALTTGFGTVVSSNADRCARFHDTATGLLRGVMIAEEDQIVLVSTDGHHRADRPAELVVVVQTEKAQETYTTAAFTSKHRHQNSPSAIKLTPR